MKRCNRIRRYSMIEEQIIKELTEAIREAIKSYEYNN